MKLSRLIAAATLMCAALPFAGAQGFRMMGGGGMTQGSVLFVFQQGEMSIRSDVSKELKLTDSQKSKLEDYQQKQMEDMRAVFQGGERPTPEQMAEITKKRNEAEAKALKEILDEGQRKRLKELWLQRLGNGAVANADIQKELAFTDEQKAKVKTLQTKQQAANQELFQKMQNGEIDRSEIRPLMEKNTKILNEEYGKILTAEQAKKLKDMAGTPFKFDEDNIG